MGERLSVLYICFDPIPSPKGASTHVTYFVRALAERYAVTLMSVGAKELAPGATYGGARHLVAPLTKENYLDRALVFRETVWDELEAHPYDIVHFRSMWAAAPVAEEKARQGYRVVAEVNAVESIELKYHYPALRGATALLARLRAQEDQAFRTADVLVTPSELTRNYLTHHQVPEEKIRVIPNGVDLDLFHPTPAGERAGPLTLLYMGTLAPWQGVDFLLEALKPAIADCPLRLQILCPDSGKWRRPVERLIGKLGLTERVEIIPAVPHTQVPAVVRQADICVAPLTPTERNLVQGCHPIKLLEYMACGKPIIASDLPVVREVLTHEANALLFKVTKPRRLTECLLQLAGDAELRRRLGEQALQTARERFSWRCAQEALLGVYEGLNHDKWDSAPYRLP